MPTNLPQRKKSFLALFVWLSVLVPSVYGVVVYEFIEHARRQWGSMSPGVYHLVGTGTQR